MRDLVLGLDTSNYTTSVAVTDARTRELLADERALLVKCADRICNTRDFVPLSGAARARSYLADACAIFAAASPTSFATPIAATLARLRADLGDVPPSCKPENNETKGE